MSLTEFVQLLSIITNIFLIWGICSAIRRFEDLSDSLEDEEMYLEELTKELEEKGLIKEIKSSKDLEELIEVTKKETTNEHCKECPWHLNENCKGDEDE